MVHHAASLPNWLHAEAACTVCGHQFRADTRYPIDLAYARRVSGRELSEVRPGVVSCPGCGHQFIHPLPDPAFFTAFYAAYMVRASTGFYRARASQTIPEEFRLRYGASLDQLRRLAPTRAQPPRLLDIGAGLGMFLRLARDYGFSPHGIEPNEQASRALERDHGIPAITSTLEAYSGRKRFDVVTMWDLLEHLPDPRAGLERARDLLVSGGILALEIPIRDSLLHWSAKSAFRLSRGSIRRPLYLVCGIHHLHYFSRSGIHRLLRELRLDVVEDHRGETSLTALHRPLEGGALARARCLAYNATLDAAFAAARLVDRQSKLVVFARAR